MGRRRRLSDHNSSYVFQRKTDELKMYWMKLFLLTYYTRTKSITKLHSEWINLVQIQTHQLDTWDLTPVCLSDSLIAIEGEVWSWCSLKMTFLNCTSQWKDHLASQHFHCFFDGSYSISQYAVLINQLLAWIVMGS